MMNIFYLDYKRLTDEVKYRNTTDVISEVS